MPVLAPISHHLDLYRYWLTKRGDRAMPARRDINPADIPLLLPFLVLVERVNDKFRYRLVGSAIVRAAGYDPTAALVGSYIPVPETAGQVRAVFKRVFTAACPVFATGEYFHETGARINASFLSLPLSEDGRVVNMSLSILVARFSAAPAPKHGWLAGVPVRVRSVSEVRDLAELEKCCREWEQRCAPVAEDRPREALTRLP